MNKLLNRKNLSTILGVHRTVWCGNEHKCIMSFLFAVIRNIANHIVFIHSFAFYSILKMSQYDKEII